MEPTKSVDTPKNVSTSEQANVYEIENLMKELKVLRNENTILKGRLRGIDTLGALLQEARDTNQRLNEQKNKLQQRLDDSLNQKEKITIASTGEVITSISDIGQIYQPITTETNDSLPVEPASSNLVQESNAVKLSVTVSGVVGGNSSCITSLVSLPDSPQATHGQTQAGMKENQVQPSDSIGDDQDLQYDSDKLEEPSYSKTEDLNSLNIVSFISPSFSEVGSSNMDEASSRFDGHLNVESLHIQSHSELHDFQIHSVCPSAGDSLNPVKLQETLLFVKEISDDRKKYRDLYHVITKENGMIKKQIVLLKDENQRLLLKIRQLEHFRDNIESESLTQAVNKDWIHISTMKVMKEEEVKRNLDHSNAIKQIGELKTANKAWQTKWDSLEKQYSTRNRSLEKEMDSLKSEIKCLSKTHEENQLEADKMLMNAKQRVEEEEEAKMAANDSLHKANQELKGVKLRVEELERELDDVKRKKSIVESELSILRNAGQERENDKKNKDTSIAVLKQQIAICTEDFERERLDRAAAQSARSVLQEENNQLVTEKQSLTAQVNRMKRQLQDIELEHTRLKSDNENHQTHISTLKAENQSLRGQLQSARAHRTYSQVQNNTPPMRESVHLPNPISPHVQAVPRTNNVKSRYPKNPSLEHLPGAWTCGRCTYINYPGRTVCEVCGCITENGNHHMQGLQPRGPLDYGQRDLVID